MQISRCQQQVVQAYPAAAPSEGHQGGWRLGQYLSWRCSLSISKTKVLWCSAVHHPTGGDYCCWGVILAVGGSVKETNEWLSGQEQRFPGKMLYYNKTMNISFVTFSVDQCIQQSTVNCPANSLARHISASLDASHQRMYTPWWLFLFKLEMTL